MGQSRAEVQQLFRSGIEAVATATSGFDTDDWERPACGIWTARETAAHLVGVIDWYHEWLDRAIAGATSRPFPEAEVDRRAEHDVERRADLSGPDAVHLFRSLASDYVERTTDHWDTVYPYPFGVVTTGLHCGVAATEWHLHAWDLAKAVARDLRPSDPTALFVAAGFCVAEAEGGLRGALLRRVVPLAARRSPWETLLKRSGR